MKKYAIVLIAGIIMWLSGCGAPHKYINSNMIDYPLLVGVAMTAEKTTYPKNVTTIDVVWKNDTDLELVFGEAYRLEKKVNGKWKEIKTWMSPSVFISIAYDVPPHSQRKHTYDLRGYYYLGLGAGQYRIATRFSHGMAPGDVDVYALYAEFIVK